MKKSPSESPKNNSSQINIELTDELKSASKEVWSSFESLVWMFGHPEDGQCPDFWVRLELTPNPGAAEILPALRLIECTDDRAVQKWLKLSENAFGEWFYLDKALRPASWGSETPLRLRERTDHAAVQRDLKTISKLLENEPQNYHEIARVKGKVDSLLEPLADDPSLMRELPQLCRRPGEIGRASARFVEILRCWESSAIRSDPPEVPLGCLLGRSLFTLARDIAKIRVEGVRSWTVESATEEIVNLWIDRVQKGDGITGMELLLRPEPVDGSDGPTEEELGRHLHAIYGSFNGFAKELLAALERSKRAGATAQREDDVNTQSSAEPNDLLRASNILPSDRHETQLQKSKSDPLNGSVVESIDPPVDIKIHERGGIQVESESNGKIPLTGAVGRRIILYMAITASEDADFVMINTDEFKRAVLYPDAPGAGYWNKTEEKLRELGCVVTFEMNSVYVVSNFSITVAPDKARLKEMLEKCRSKPKKRRKRQRRG